MALTARQRQWVAQRAAVRAAPQALPASRVTAVVPGGWFGGWLGVVDYWNRPRPGGGTMWGVTDGSDTQPGQIGEYIQHTGTLGVPQTGSTMQMAVLGTLPAGDWDCWAYINFSVLVNDAQFAMNPIPDGFSGNLTAIQANTSALEAMILLSPTVRALTSVPSLIALEVITNSQGPTTSPPGEMAITFAARRRR